MQCIRGRGRGGAVGEIKVVDLESKIAPEKDFSIPTAEAKRKLFEPIYVG